MFKNLVYDTRSVRRYIQEKDIDYNDIIDMIDTARITPSGANLQPLKYMIVNQKKAKEDLFQCLSWAGYLDDWKCPAEGEKPNSYILILGDKEISSSFSVDLGISAYAICLRSRELGIGACMIGALDRKKIIERFNIKSRYELLLVISLGYPFEEVKLEKVIGNNIRYFRDKDKVHHVPKRDIDDIIIN